MNKHNHFTRDIKPFGECDLCDKHYHRYETAIKELQAENEELRKEICAHNLAAEVMKICGEFIEHKISETEKARL